jgi:hypothetical protein
MRLGRAQKTVALPDFDPAYVSSGSTCDYAESIPMSASTSSGHVPALGLVRVVPKAALSNRSKITSAFDVPRSQNLQSRGLSNWLFCRGSIGNHSFLRSFHDPR